MNIVIQNKTIKGFENINKSLCNTTIPINITQIVICAENATSHFSAISVDFLAFNVGFLLLALLIIFANSAVLTLYFRTRALHTSNNHLLISLACTDLLAGLVNIPLISLSAIMIATGKNVIPLHFSVHVVSDFMVIVNELNLFLIFLDRYVVICHPLSSRTITTESRRVNSITAIWLTAAVFAILPLSWCFKVVAERSYTNAYMSRMNELITLHSVSVMICCFIVPSVVMLCFLVAMIKSLNRHKRKRKKQLRIRKDDCNFRAYRKAFCMLTAMYVLMLVAWSPLMIVRLFLDLKVRLEITSMTFNCLMLLRFFTALVNPFIYTFAKPEFRDAFFKTYVYSRIASRPHTT